MDPPMEQPTKDDEQPWVPPGMVPDSEEEGAAWDLLQKMRELLPPGALLPAAASSGRGGLTTGRGGAPTGRG
eukprot:7255393-Prorocentrum_lima.AAC.1